MTPARRRRTGFTLVELLVVITILGVLIALLVPAIWGAVGRANNTRVAADMNVMAQAMASFRTKFGEFPPSRVILPENGAYNIANPPDDYFGAQTAAELNGTVGKMIYETPYQNIGGVPAVSPDADVSYATLAQRSISALRKFFPKVQLSTGSGISGTVPGAFYDFNGNRGSTPDPQPILAEGHECLVFFLGGIPNHDQAGTVNTLSGTSGFSSNPRNPFQARSLSGGDPRIAPFFEFAADRLVDDDADGIPGYIDSLGRRDQGRYFAYFSSYAGSGYDPNDVNLAGAAIGEIDPVGRSFQLSFPVATADGTATRVTTSPLPNPYTSSVLAPANGGAATFINAQSFQIISAGRDRLYGPGGQYLAGTDADRLPVYDPDTRLRERDNITNFSNGTLD